MSNSYDLAKVFDYHPPSGLAKQMHQEWRAHSKRLAVRIMADIPSGRERSQALTKLEECSFWVHAAIARHPELHEKTEMATQGAST